MKIPSLIVLLSVASMCFGARNNIGKEFIVGFLDNEETGTSLDLEIFVTTISNSPANVTVTAPAYIPTLLLETIVARGTVSKLTLPYVLRGVGSASEMKGILIESTEEITVYCVNQETYSTDAFVAVPTEALGTSYYILTYRTNPEMLFVGTEDGTDIHIILPSPSQPISIVFGGVTYIDGDVLKLRIGRFETVHLYQEQTNVDFTGTFIQANKPIAVFSGNRKIPVPILAGSSDHVVEQMTPINTWGKEFVFISTPDRTTGDLVRIMAAEASTTVTISGVGSITIASAGGFYELGINSGEVKSISALKPVLVGVFSKTDAGSDPNGGDPSMYLLTPRTQYAPNYVFSTIETSTGNFTNYLSIVVNVNATSGLRLDNVAIDSLGITWINVPDSADLVAGTVSVSPGSHDVYHEDPTVVFMGLCTGVAPFSSYAFSSGMRLGLINEPCSPTSAVPGDVVDNDCDGRIDEEEANGIDDDNDAAIDEDLAAPRRVNGGFSVWTSWTTCTVSCGGNGTTSRNRNCDNPAPAQDGLPCSGSLSEIEVCVSAIADCPIDGNWSEWGNWSACSVTCGSGNLTRSRSCTEPAPQFNGTDCVGVAEEAQSCDTGVLCPVDGNWGVWTPWSVCSVTCSSGSRERSRLCDNPAAANGGADCVGQANETESCNTGVSCPVDGGFQSWTLWSACSVTCENGTQTRSRDCNNPTPQFGGANCSGDFTQLLSCDTGIRCPLPGGWGTWGPMSACSLTCGAGVRVRNRPCNNPVPDPGGDCPGVELEMEQCNTQVCDPSHSNMTCIHQWFPCRDGSACIYFLLRCDCSYDCADGSDEDVEYARCVPDIDKCMMADATSVVLPACWLIWLLLVL
ncbi:uncharacterized protein LOC124256280 [Haliotis rubra]|uniref:uncharacterized protein LOC124256280 n=1 Tax=Haliotis rubra TaxID=36100 RepID=UPI001EE59A39|nr:uncharacterized protein LOC124256280 [Haliotis rubra]